jgi:hypothetical protein
VRQFSKKFVLGCGGVVVDGRSRCGLKSRTKEQRDSVSFLPWWLLLVCLVVSALATYFLLERTQAGDSPWALYPLTAVLAPVVLARMVFVGLALSTFLSALLEDQSAQPTDEGTGTERTLERKVPATRSTPPSTTPSASPTASPTASPAASPASSPTASPTASPSP